MVIAELKDTENGMQVDVHQITAAKFSVVVIDTDAGEVAGIKFYGDLDKAMAFARKCIA